VVTHDTIFLGGLYYTVKKQASFDIVPAK